MSPLPPALEYEPAEAEPDSVEAPFVVVVTGLVATIVLVPTEPFAPLVVPIVYPNKCERPPGPVQFPRTSTRPRAPPPPPPAVRVADGPVKTKLVPA